MKSIKTFEEWLGEETLTTNVETSSSPITKKPLKRIPKNKGEDCEPTQN